MASRAVVLLSGGLDSAVALAVAQRDQLQIFALTVRYGQRHAVEIECAKRIAQAAGVREHKIIDLDLAAWGGSSLTGDGEIPKGLDPPPSGDAIPSTYVPARNTVLLSLALAWAEVLEAEAIYIGAHTQDAGGYPDTRPAYLEAFSRMAALATRVGIEGRGPEIRAPLLRMTKGEIVSLGWQLGLDLTMTSSCYDPSPSGEPCGTCDACRLRAAGFRAAGSLDRRAKDK